MTIKTTKLFRTIIEFVSFFFVGAVSGLILEYIGLTWNDSDGYIKCVLVIVSFCIGWLLGYDDWNYED